MTPPCQSTGPAAQQWAEALAAWAFPEEILAAAPQSPYGYDVGMFSRLADEALDQETPSQQMAHEALPDGGRVLDVGCGGGAASLPLAPPATFIVGLDQSAAMLQAFAQRAAARGVVHETIEGAWPDVADQAPVVDVVVCHNVFYNVSDLQPFVQRLTEQARGRVVVQLTQHHPLSWMNPLWKELHGIDRPHGPTADDAAAVVREAGVDPVVQHWTGPMKAGRTGDELVAFVRQRLCLASERDPGNSQADWALPTASAAPPRHVVVVATPGNRPNTEGLTCPTTSTGTAMVPPRRRCARDCQALKERDARTDA